MPESTPEQIDLRSDTVTRPTEAMWQAMRSARARQLAEPDFWQAEAGVVCCDHDIASEHDLESATESRAVCRANHRLEQVVAVGEAAETAGPFFLGQLFAARSRLHVITRAEGFVAFAGNDCHPRLVVRRECVEGLAQFDICKIVQCIARFDAPDRNSRNRAVPPIADTLELVHA